MSQQPTELDQHTKRLLGELTMAHKIILNAINVMPIEQKIAWGEANAQDGIEGMGITRRFEREHAIEQATTAMRWATDFANIESITAQEAGHQKSFISKAAPCACGNIGCDGKTYRPLYTRTHLPCPALHKRPPDNTVTINATGRVGYITGCEGRKVVVRHEEEDCLTCFTSFDADEITLYDAARQQSCPVFFFVAPQGSGKTSSARRLADLLGCPTVTDDWNDSDPLSIGTLAVTSEAPSQIPPNGVVLSVSSSEGIQTLLNAFQPKAA